MKILIEKKELAHILGSKKFFIYSRIWWDGASIDLYGIYENNEGYFVEEKWIAGESTEPKSSRLIDQRSIEEKYLYDLSASFRNLDLNHKQNMRFYMHYDVAIGLKTDHEDWLYLFGGDSDNEEISEFSRKLLDVLPIKSVAES